MNVINDINNELKELRFNYYWSSKACNPENPRYNPNDTIQNVDIYGLINLINGRMTILNCLDDVAVKKAEAPSQFYAKVRNKWDKDVQFFFVDIDTTEGADLLFGQYQDKLFKTFKNIVYMQKSWSGKIHVCIYVKTDNWDEQKWKERCLFAAGLFNEWCAKILGINYIDILDKSGKPVLDAHMFTLTQPFKFSDNDFILNPYFNRNAASNGSTDSKQEIIIGTGLTYNDIVKTYRNLLHQNYNNDTDVSSVLDYSKNLSFAVGKAPNNKYAVVNNSRLCMVSALMAGNMSDDDILKLMSERTCSNNGGAEHNKKETINQIRQCKSSISNPNFKKWVATGLRYLKHINVIYQAEIETDNIKPQEPAGESIHLADNEYISDNHLTTWYNNVKDNKCVIIEAPTGTGKTEAAKRLSFIMADEGYMSIIVTNTCALSGEYGKEKDIKRVDNMTTYMTEGNVYSMVFDKFVQYFNFIRNKKVFIIVDEVHTVTENMTFREVCIQLGEIMDSIRELDNIKLLMMSATPDYLTINKFKDIAKQLYFTRTDTRKFQFKLVGNMELKQAIIKAKKNDWADHICIFSDMGVGMDHTRALSGDDKPSDLMWKGVSFGSNNDKYIGYYVSKHNDNWKDITMIDELVQSEKLKPHICMCTSAVFAGTNVKNEHEKFLILIDYSEFVSTADVRQILGRFRSDTNEYKVIILINDSKWADWRDFGGIEMYESDKNSMMMPELNFIETTAELRKQSEGNAAYSELLRLNSAYQHTNVNKLVFDYFMNEHMAKNCNGDWMMTYSKLLSALKLYDGVIMLGTDFTADGDLTIKDDTLCITDFIDMYFKQCKFDINKIRDNCQQRVYEKKEAEPIKQTYKVDTSVNSGQSVYNGQSGQSGQSGHSGYNTHSGHSGYNTHSGHSGYNLYTGNSGVVDVSTWFDASTAADLSTLIKKPKYIINNVFEDKIHYVKDYMNSYKDDLMGFTAAFKNMANKCPEVYPFIGFEPEDIDYNYLFDYFTEAECNSMIGIYSNADRSVRDILYNDKILAPHAEKVIGLWKYRTERTANSFIKHMRYSFGAYKINEREYEKFVAQIERNIDIYNERWAKTTDEYVKNSIMADIKAEQKAMAQMQLGRDSRINSESIDDLRDRIIWDYGSILAKKLDGNKKGGRKGGRLGSKEDKSKAGKVGGKAGKKCVVVANYNDGHCVRLEAKTQKEMIEKIKELCGGVIYGNTDGFVKEWLAGRNAKVFSCKPLGISHFEKCALEDTQS